MKVKVLIHGLDSQEHVVKEHEAFVCGFAFLDNSGSLPRISPTASTEASVMPRDANEESTCSHEAPVDIDAASDEASSAWLPSSSERSNFLSVCFMSAEAASAFFFAPDMVGGVPTGYRRELIELAQNGAYVLTNAKAKEDPSTHSASETTGASRSTLSQNGDDGRKK